MPFETEFAAPDSLVFDPKNPRLPKSETPSVIEAITALFEQADVNELVQSIAHSGWLDYEPLIVRRRDNVVLEGNRRLAALRILADTDLQHHFGVSMPDDVHPNARPAEIRVAFVHERRDARDFIGFKHVNGPHKWDSLAKARFAWEWLEEDPDLKLDDVARRLGDGHNTVARLVNGYVVLEQAKDLGFDEDKRTAGRFAFSHLYTILARPNARDWLGLDAPINDLLPKHPVDGAHREALLQLMTWLYGQGEARSVIKSQNPNLNELTEVLGNKVARQILAAEHDLGRAYAQVEDRSKHFSEMLFALQGAARDVLASVGDYEHDEDLQDIAEGIQRTVRSIVASMTAARGASEAQSVVADARDDAS
ncbi:hypothetical protein [Cellulomonas sp. Y8]|uniref:hypothetical protein n=1 Tax=Cellulomonas sp. Y8 TaxID=2591145 RepID=UPI003D719E79